MSEKCAEKKFHANDDDRGYTLTELNYAIVYRSRLERNGNFLFPFWEDGKNHKKDIPDAVVFCRSGLIERIRNKYTSTPTEWKESVTEKIPTTPSEIYSRSMRSGVT